MCKKIVQLIKPYSNHGKRVIKVEVSEKIRDEKYMKLIFMMYASDTNTEKDKHCIITPSLFHSTVCSCSWKSYQNIKAWRPRF